MERVAFGLDRIGRADLGREFGREPGRGAAVNIGKHADTAFPRASPEEGEEALRSRARRGSSSESISSRPRLTSWSSGFVKVSRTGSNSARPETKTSVGVRELVPRKAIFPESAEKLKSLQTKSPFEERGRLSRLRGNREELVPEARGALKEDPAAVGGPLRGEHEFVELGGEVARRPALGGDETEIPVGDPLRLPLGRKESDLSSVRRPSGERIDSGPLDQVPDRSRLEVDREDVRSKQVRDARRGLGREGDRLSVGRPRKVDDGRRGPGQRTRVLRYQVEDKELEAGNIRIVHDHVRGRVRGLVRLERFRVAGEEPRSSGRPETRRNSTLRPRPRRA